jgi:L-ribulose-5-phosphate 4-epimerase
MNSEGFIKFNCKRIEEIISLPENTFESLTKWRQSMFETCLIGVYSDGVGYGNISVRATPQSFYISGTATGRLPALEEKHYSHVNSWSFSENSLICTGTISASAESLSHAIIYETLPDVGAVIHIHHKGMWEKYVYHMPTTSQKILYGTPDMAKEIKKIIITLKPDQDPILVMGGHDEGIIVWGKTLDNAGETVLKYYNSFLKEGELI